jgi:hypothetical protein
MGSNLMARYAAEAQAEANSDQHDKPRPVRRGDYAAQAVLDYHVQPREASDNGGGVVRSNREAASR